MSNNRYTFTTKLEGFVRMGEPGGKYNNCSFSFRIPEGVLKEIEADQAPLIDWAKKKAAPRALQALPKWDEDGVVKYSYGGDSNNPEFPIIDSKGDLVPSEVIKSINKDTVVQIIVQQKPYTKPNYGTTLKVLGMQIIELVTGFSSDSGSLDADEVFNLLGAKEGYTTSDPQPTPTREDEEDEEEDVPF